MARKNRRDIAFTLYPGVTPLDLIGPLSVLRDLKLGTPYRTVVVGERVEPLPTDSALRMVPAARYDDAPAPYALFVPGGPGAVEAMRDAAMLRYLRSAAETAELIGSTGSGALVLAAAGLLEDQRATTHWAWAEMMAGMGATYVPERWVEDGRFLTSAGGSAGIDMMLHLVDRLKGRSRAMLTQIAVEYDPHPPLGGIDPTAAAPSLADRITGRRGAASDHPDELPTPATPAPRGETTIAVVLYPGLTLLDLVGPLQVLTALERLVPGYRVVVVGERIEPMDTDVRVRVMPDATFGDVPSPDVLVVPGGRLPTIRAMSDPAIRRYVLTASDSARFVTSVCTGSLILAAVGLLEGRRAATNWFYTRILEQFGATCVSARWVEDGRFITSAGVSAGIDMALVLVSKLTDEPSARQVQLALDYDPRPPFGPIDWDHVPLLPRLMRGGISLAAPIVAIKPKRLTGAERAGRHGAASPQQPGSRGVR